MFELSMHGLHTSQSIISTFGGYIHFLSKFTIFIELSAFLMKFILCRNFDFFVEFAK